jgi:hypothetical protein
MLIVATSRGEERRGEEQRGDCEASNEREASCGTEKMGASRHRETRLPSDWQQLLTRCKNTYSATRRGSVHLHLRVDERKLSLERLDLRPLLKRRGSACIP